MSFNYDEVPDEVRRLWMWSMNVYVGMEYIEERKRLVKKYPEWFPWDVKYNSIPEHVHAAYRAEAFPPMDFSMWNKNLDDDVSAKGLIPTILEYNPQPVSMDSSKSWIKQLENLFVEENRRQKELYNQTEKKFYDDKALWDKHYAPYGLEYYTTLDEIRFFQFRSGLL